MLPVRLVTAPGQLPAGARVVAVDGSWPASAEPRRAGGLHLAHWPGNDTPADLKRDLSTEIAFAFLDLDGSEREARTRGCEALVLNHYDPAGVCALLALGFFAHGVWQVSTLSNEREARALGVFKSNIYAGLIVLAGLCLAAFL